MHFNSESHDLMKKKNGNHVLKASTKIKVPDSAQYFQPNIPSSKEKNPE